MTVFLFHHQCIGVDSGLDLILEEERWKCSTFFFGRDQMPSQNKTNFETCCATPCYKKCIHVEHH